MTKAEDAYSNIESELRREPNTPLSPRQRKILFRNRNLYLKFVENETGHTENASGTASLVDNLTYLKEHAIPLLSKLTDHEQKSIRQSAISALFSIGTPAGQTLVRCLKDGRSDIVAHIVARFSCFPDLSSTISNLVPVLSSLEEEHQNMLLSPVLASSFDEDDVTGELIGVLMQSDLAEVRTDPLEHFLAQYAMYDTAGIQLFSKLLLSKESSLQLAALRVLVQHGDPGILQPLLTDLEHGSRSMNPLISGLSDILLENTNKVGKTYSSTDLRAYVDHNEQLKPLRNALRSHLNDKLNGEVVAFVLPVFNSEDTVKAQINTALNHLGFPRVFENTPDRQLNVHNDLMRFIQHSGFNWCGSTSEEDAAQFLKHFVSLFQATTLTGTEQNPSVFTSTSTLTGAIFDHGYIFSNDKFIGMIWVSDED